MALIQRQWDRIDEKPWLEHATVLLKILTAPTGKEFDRRAKGFWRAYKGFRDCLITNRRNPDSNSGQSIQDPTVENVLLQLNGATLNWRGYPGDDIQTTMRRAGIASKVHKLMMARAWTPK